MNVFEGGGGRYVEMTNGGTAVFVDVLMLAVSAPAREPWDREACVFCTARTGGS